MTDGVRVSFVAGGGAVKAYAFHVGVLRGMVEDGFVFRSGARWNPSVAPPGAREITSYVGSSAGACLVTGLATGIEVEDFRLALLGEVPGKPRFGYRVLFVPVAPNPLRFLRRAARRWKLGSRLPQELIDFGGLFTAAGVERYFRKHALPTNRFADLAAELYLVTTQVNTSRKVVFGPRDSLAEGGYDDSCAYYDNVVISQAVAAAVSVPPVFAPYGIVNPSTGRTFHYYDGEVREPLSMHVARDTGADFIIAASMWSPYRFDERVGSLADYGMSVIGEQALIQMISQKVDRDRDQASRFDRLLELLEVRGRRHGLDAVERQELQDEVSTLLQHRRTRTLFIAPDPSDSEFFFHGSFRFGARLIDRCIQTGYRAYRHAVEEDPAFLSELDAAIAGAAG
jgi:predicted acylesterase/phospholipase RssA